MTKTMLGSQTKLIAKTPEPGCPFNSDSISEAFMAIISAEPRSAEAGYIKSFFSMRIASFSWTKSINTPSAISEEYVSSFTFIYDIKEDVYISPLIVKKAIETHWDDPEVNGDAYEVNYLYNEIQLVITIKHKY